jgi:Xaa-Pro aminopeptidase
MGILPSKLGAQNAVVFFSFNCYGQQGTKSFEPHAAASGHPSRPVQLLCLVLWATATHYMAAVERTILLAEIFPQQRNYYDAVFESLQRVLKKCVSG